MSVCADCGHEKAAHIKDPVIGWFCFELNCQCAKFKRRTTKKEPKP